MVLKGHPESQVLKVSGESLVLLENKVYLVPQAQMDLPDLWAHLAYLV